MGIASLTLFGPRGLLFKVDSYRDSHAFFRFGNNYFERITRGSGKGHRRVLLVVISWIVRCLTGSERTAVVYGRAAYRIYNFVAGVVIDFHRLPVSLVTSAAAAL